MDECNLYDAITKTKIEQCPDPDEECFNFDYTKTSVNSILTEDYGIMYRLRLQPYESIVSTITAHDFGRNCTQC